MMWRLPDQAALDAITKRSETRHVKLLPKGATNDVQRVSDDSKPYKGPKKVRAPKKIKVPESKVLELCGEILETHPKVVLWWRNSTGVGRFGDRWVKFSFKGASDLFFVLAGGRFGACETKATGEKPSEDQSNFLANVNEAGGLGLWCDDPSILLASLDAL